MPPPRKNYVINQTDFDRLLEWLGDGGDAEQAALEYEKIRRRLIVIFAGRGCDAPEELADETIDRAARRVAQIEAVYAGDKARYFYGVANFIYQEYLRRKSADAAGKSTVLPARETADERRFECLEKCLAAISAESRKMIVGYYTENKQAKIDARKTLADELGLSGNALRHRVKRLRAEMKKCVEKCLAKNAAGDTNRD